MSLIIYLFFFASVYLLIHFLGFIPGLKGLEEKSMSSVPNWETLGGKQRGNYSGLRANFLYYLFFSLSSRKSQEEKSSQTKNLTQHKTLCSSIVRKTSEMSSKPCRWCLPPHQQSRPLPQEYKESSDNWMFHLEVGHFCPINTAYRGAFITLNLSWTEGKWLLNFMVRASHFQPLLCCVWKMARQLWLLPAWKWGNFPGKCRRRQNSSSSHTFELKHFHTADTELPECTLRVEE